MHGVQQRRRAIISPAVLDFAFYSKALFGDGFGLRGAGFGATWRPVFGRESDAPELRPGGGKLEADFRFFTAHRTEENNVAFLFFFGAMVLQLEHAAAGDARA